MWWTASSSASLEHARDGQHRRGGEEGGEKRGMRKTRMRKRRRRRRRRRRKGARENQRGVANEGGGGDAHQVRRQDRSRC